MSRSGHRFESHFSLFSVFFSLFVALSPFGLGGNRPVFWALSALIFGTCGAFFFLSYGRTFIAGITGPFLFPAFGFSCVLLWCLAQALWGPYANLSLSPPLTRMAALRFLTAFIVFFVSYFLAKNKKNALFMVRFFLISATLFGVYGFFVWIDPQIAFFEFGLQERGRLASTFVNPNTAATYFGFSLCACLGLLLKRIQNFPVFAGTSHLRKVFFLIDGVCRFFWFEVLCFFLLLSCLLLTSSRAGITASLIALIFSFSLFLFKRQRPWFAYFAICVGAGIFLYGAFSVSGASVIQHFLSSGIEDSRRFAVWQDTLLAIKEHFWFGAGYGTFEDLYPLYRFSELKAGTWDKAHNDYLELFLGLGGIFSLVFLVSFLFSFFLLIKGVLIRRKHYFFPLVGVGVLSTACLHSFFDFSMQIQAISLIFSFLLGISLAQSEKTER